MNQANVRKAIAVMERVKARGDAFDLRNWQGKSVPTSLEFNPAETEQELHDCGTPACFAGWLAVSPEWIADGGGQCCLGSPEMDNRDEDHAIAYWLGIDWQEAASLCGVGYARYVYPASTSEVTVDHVLQVLYRLLNTGSCLLPEYRS